MNINNIALPYPVLSHRDDIRPPLGKDDWLRPEVIQEEKYYCFKITLKHDNEDIRQLIDRGDAEYACEIECPRTFYRKYYTSQEPHFEIRISKYDVCRDIIFSCVVVVKKFIKDYKNQGFHPDYDGISFDMERGNLLVAFPNFSYSTDIRYDSLQNAGTFMQLRENGNKKETLTKFDITDDKIDIVLPSNLYQNYVQQIPQGNKDYMSIIHSSLVCNALSYALLRIQDHPDTLWARTLRYRLRNDKKLACFSLDEENGIATDEIPEVAQVLLGNPYERLFNSLIEIQQNNEEEE